MGKKRVKCRSKSCVRARKRHQSRVDVHTSSTCSLPSIIIYSSKEQSLFEKYIYKQQWLPSQEHSSFFRTLKQTLPITFRIRDQQTLQEWESEFLSYPHISRIATKLPHPSNSCPSWQVLPFALEDFHFRYWLSSNTKTGHISRQEFVSMIPVFLLDIKSHHRVLDLCSSPGSKTIQALDSLYQHHEEGRDSSNNSSNSNTNNSPPSGYVIANEIDPPRAYILAHRCRRTLSHRLQSLAITCHNACKFPDALAPLNRYDQHSERSFQQEQQQSEKNNTLLFDRIICDVPCSGDGTLRKDTKVWKTWHPTYGITLHSLQIRIAKRGIALLKIGGLMTYSTCSFHPIENEAVVTALLQTGCVEVASEKEIQSLMSGIKYRQGLTTWKVLGDECEELFLEDHTKKKNEKNSSNEYYPLSLWPPSPDMEMYDYIKSSLTRCIRMVPNDNNTGGFFIALLRKIKNFPNKLDYSTKIKSNSKVMVTPKAVHHNLYPVVDDISPNEPSTVFTRSPVGNGKHFKVSYELAKYMSSCPGSKKLNIVCSGHYLRGTCS